ncbi:hypothetical protein L1987_52793 [Smallanthus sonchifolius]|uniref:Uncharacterized protein n=1 Tax=Smallanthus sonchifolius TaxID=185202 RepID=A0ACB9EU29_9ASTR|nr:hypothetical protein L1987_52793 [Smallanthus sonchifolius]
MVADRQRTHVAGIWKRNRDDVSRNLIQGLRTRNYVIHDHQKARGVKFIQIRHRYKWRELVLRQNFTQSSLYVV